MLSIKAGIIRVITLKDEQLKNLHGKLIEKYVPWIKTESICIKDQPEGIHNIETRAQAVPKVIETAGYFSDYDVLIISCADDPGVEELKKITDKPVVGAGSSAAALAKRYGKRTGIIGITDYTPEPLDRIFGEDIINLGRPDGVEDTLDLMSEEGKASVINKAKELKIAGASSITLACTGMSTIGIAGDIERETGLPVIDPVMAEAVCAYYEILKRRFTLGD